jgi:hypothetical protein
MTHAMAGTDGMALKLVERYGKSGLAYADEHVTAAIRDGDWHGVKAWRAVGSEFEKLVAR